MSQTTTRDEKRSALDQFATAARQEVATVPGIAFQPPAELPHGAMALAVHRDEADVLRKLKALAAAAGSDWFYRFPVKNRKENRTDYIEGPSIKLANDVARIYGNCEVDCRAQDFGDTWLFHARFIDLETGFSLARPFQQRKSGSRMGGNDDERRLDIAFQIGASKAIRNVVVNALQTFADYAFEEARESLVEKIGRELDKYRTRTIERIAANKLELGRVEAVIGRTAKEWLAPDVARIIALMTAIKDGMASVDETFPPLATQTATDARSSALDEFAGQKAEAALGAAAGGVGADPTETETVDPETGEVTDLWKENRSSAS